VNQHDLPDRSPTLRPHIIPGQLTGTIGSKAKIRFRAAVIEQDRRYGAEKRNGVVEYYWIVDVWDSRTSERGRTNNVTSVHVCDRDLCVRQMRAWLDDVDAVYDTPEEAKALYDDAEQARLKHPGGVLEDPQPALDQLPAAIVGTEHVRKPGEPLPAKLPEVRCTVIQRRTADSLPERCGLKFADWVRNWLDHVAGGGNLAVVRPSAENEARKDARKVG